MVYPKHNNLLARLQDLILKQDYKIAKSNLVA